MEIPWMNMLCLKQGLLTGVFLSSVERPVKNCEPNKQHTIGFPETDSNCMDTKKPSGTLAVIPMQFPLILATSRYPIQLNPNQATKQPTYLPAWTPVTPSGTMVMTTSMPRWTGWTAPKPPGWRVASNQRAKTQQALQWYQDVSRYLDGYV